MSSSAGDPSLALHTAIRQSHRTIDPHAFKIPAPQGRNLPQRRTSLLHFTLSQDISSSPSLPDHDLFFTSLLNTKKHSPGDTGRGARFRFAISHVRRPWAGQFPVSRPAQVKGPRSTPGCPRRTVSRRTRHCRGIGCEAAEHFRSLAYGGSVGQTEIVGKLE